MEGEGHISKKRRNKNRPEEKSSKVPPRQKSKVPQPIDPRFDSAFGEFNEKSFNTSYDFINKIKKREKFQLKRQLRKEKDPEEIKKIKYLLLRTENQERERKKRELKQKKIEEEKQKYAEAVFAGEQPKFPNRKERLTEELLENFEHLKSKGKLNKYIKKKTLKQKAQYR